MQKNVPRMFHPWYQKQFRGVTNNYLGPYNKNAKYIQCDVSHRGGMVAVPV